MLLYMCNSCFILLKEQQYLQICIYTFLSQIKYWFMNELRATKTKYNYMYMVKFPKVPYVWQMPLIAGKWYASNTNTLSLMYVRHIYPLTSLDRLSFIHWHCSRWAEASWQRPRRGGGDSFGYVEAFKW